MVEDGFTDNKIVDIVIIDEIEFMLVLKKVSSVKVKKAIDKIIRFLYE